MMLEKTNPAKNIKVIVINAGVDNGELNEANSFITKGSKLTIEGYPTIFKIVNGELFYFNQERTPENLEKFFSIKKVSKAPKKTKTTKAPKSPKAPKKTKEQKQAIENKLKEIDLNR